MTINLRVLEAPCDPPARSSLPAGAAAYFLPALHSLNMPSNALN